MLKRVFSVLLLASCVAFAITGPYDRVPTDPKSVTAPVNPNARPIPIEDLFYGRPWR